MTTREGVFEVMAAASAAMVTSVDAAEILGSLVRDCLEPLGAQAAAVLVVGETGKLELLSASAHRSAEIEMLQVQHSEGPCVDAIARGEHVSARGAETIVDLWGEVGTAIVEAGFDGIDAYPLQWQGRVVGGLNVFRTGTTPDESDAAAARALADVVTLVLVRAIDLTPDEIAERVQAAIADRSAIEQAKGILAYLHGCSTDEAHERLVRLADRDDVTLLGAARALIAGQQAG